MNNYPKTDTELRMWCIEKTMSQDSSLAPATYPDIEQARELYDFICPSASRQEYRRLFTKLVFMYLRHQDTSINATEYAENVFRGITGEDYLNVLFD